MDWLLDRTIEPADTDAHRDLQVRNAASKLTIGQVSRFCDGQYRDILARLIAFCPASLAAVPFEVLVVRNGKRLGLEKQLAASFERIVLGLDAGQLRELDRFDGRHADERGWRQLFAILGWEDMVASLDATVAAEIRRPPVSLGMVAQPSQIGFDRTAYNRWLEESLGLGAPHAAKDALSEPAAREDGKEDRCGP